MYPTWLNQDYSKWTCLLTVNKLLLIRARQHALYYSHLGKLPVVLPVQEVWMFAFLSPSAKYNWLLCQFILNQIPLKRKKKRRKKKEKWGRRDAFNFSNFGTFYPVNLQHCPKQKKSTSLENEVIDVPCNSFLFIPMDIGLAASLTHRFVHVLS